MGMYTPVTWDSDLIIWSPCNVMKRSITLYCYQILSCIASIFFLHIGNLVVRKLFLHSLDSSTYALFLHDYFCRDFFLWFISTLHTLAILIFLFYFILSSSLSIFPSNFYYRLSLSLSLSISFFLCCRWCVVLSFLSSFTLSFYVSFSFVFPEVCSC